MSSLGSNNYQAARYVIFTTTGTINNLNNSGAGMIIMNNATLSTITGIIAKFAGQIVVIVSIGAANVELAHQNAFSSAANRFINIITASNTVLTPGKAAIYQYDANTLRWRLVGITVIDASQITTGILPVANGGTGLSTISQGDLLYGSATDVLSRLSKDTNATRYVSNQGTSNNPSWNQVNLANGVTGTLPVTNGGTGIASLTADQIPFGAGTSPFGSSSNFKYASGSGLVLNNLFDISGAAGGQVKFPATQNPSSDANTLDDYEEGLSGWTPGVGGSGGQTGQVYTLQLGNYLKIGKFVYVNYAVVLSTLGTITGNAIITGLPFTIAGGINSANPLSWAALTTLWDIVQARLLNATTTLGLVGTTIPATNSVTALVQADLSATSTFIGSAVFIASA